MRKLLINTIPILCLLIYVSTTKVDVTRVFSLLEGLNVLNSLYLILY